MSRRRNTEDLLIEFSQNPGAENEQLEFKSKEILESTGGKKKVIRTIAAMANRSGIVPVPDVPPESDAVAFGKSRRQRPVQRRARTPVSGVCTVSLGRPRVVL